jgi:hypothetical protein
MINTGGWKIRTASFDNGLSYSLKAEIEPDLFRALREKSNELSRGIVENEEYIILSGMTTEALHKLKVKCENELNERGCINEI